MNESMRSKVIGCFVLVLFSSLSAEAVEIRVKRECRISGSLVRLGDVADVTGGDSGKAAAAAQIVLFPSPSRARVLTSQELQRLLRLHGMNLAECRLTGAASSHISRATRAGASKNKKAVVVSAAAHASQESTIVVARRPLRRGETIRSADVELKPARENTSRNVYFRVQDVVGMETLRSLRTGEPLEDRAVQPPIVIRRGEIVTAVAVASGVRVRTTAHAMEDGRRGDLILVQTPDKKHKYAARVTDYQTVEVFASGRRVTR